MSDAVLSQQNSTLAALVKHHVLQMPFSNAYKSPHANVNLGIRTT